MWMFKTRARIYTVYNITGFIFQSPGDCNLMNIYFEIRGVLCVVSVGAVGAFHISWLVID